MKFNFEESKRVLKTSDNLGFECYSAHTVTSDGDGGYFGIIFNAFSKNALNPVLSSEAENEAKRNLRLYRHAEEMLEMLESIGSVDFDADALDALCKRVRGIGSLDLDLARARALQLERGEK